jgi:hypothetical protein
MRLFGSSRLCSTDAQRAGSGWTVPGHRTFAADIVSAAHSDKSFASPSRLRSAFYAVASGTVHPEPRRLVLSRES